MIGPCGRANQAPPPQSALREKRDVTSGMGSKSGAITLTEQAGTRSLPVQIPRQRP